MSKKIEYLSDYAEEAQERRESFGMTDKYKTGLEGLDRYLGSGFGNQYGYEIITVFGETGVGKSMFALNMVGQEMARGTRIGLMVLEDDMPDVYNRVRQIIGENGMAAMARNHNVDVLPQSMLEKPWTFEDILAWLEHKHDERKISLFLIDHINFVFDNAEAIRGDNELVRQRKFMQQLNFLCRRLRLTVILVSHTAKGDAEGMARVYGTTAITQVSTKVIGVKAGDGQELVVSMYKSRFTRRQDNPWKLRREGLRLEEFPYQPVTIPNKKK